MWFITYSIRKKYKNILHSTIINSAQDHFCVGRCRVLFPVALVDLAVRSFPWFSPKLEYIRVRIPYKDPHEGHTTYSPMSHKQTTGLKPTTTTIFVLHLIILVS